MLFLILILNFIISFIFSQSSVSLISNPSAGYDNGIGTNAKYYNPVGIDISSDGLFAVISDRNNANIRKLVITTLEVSILAGAIDGSTGTANGIGTVVLLHNPYGLSLSNDDSYALICDYSNNQIRKLEIATRTVTLFAGASTGTSGTANGIGTSATFLNPWGVSFAPNGIYALITDYGNQYILILIN